MMERHQRQQEPKTRNTHVSRTSCALHTCLQSYLPLLFFTTLIIAGTISLSYSLFLEQPVPRQFVVAITITFAALISIAVTLYIVKALRAKRAQEAKGDLEQRLPEYYGPPRTSRLSHMFLDLPTPPTVHLSDGLGATIEAVQHNPDLEQPAEQVTCETFGPSMNNLTSEFGRQRDGFGIPAGPSTTIGLAQGQEQNSRMDSSHPDAPKQMKHNYPRTLTAQQFQDIPLRDLIPEDLQTGTPMGSDPSGHPAQRARPERRSAQVRPKGIAKPAATIKDDRPWYDVEPVPL